MVAEVEIKKWGNSLGVILPKSLVEEMGLEVSQKIDIQVIKKGNITDLFGILPRKMSGQAMKDMLRKEWAE